MGSRSTDNRSTDSRNTGSRSTVSLNIISQALVHRDTRNSRRTSLRLRISLANR
jgi:hypothetical protein